MSSEREQVSRDDLASQWQRLASELRACKEAQRRTWGTLNDVTLGRYLAGEASGEEVARVEGEMLGHPELRQLTDLVRDVLGELEPIDATPIPSPPPRLLSWDKARARRPVYEWVRRRSSLLAAACLLVVLGAAMPRSGFLSAPLADAPGDAPEPALAARGVARAEEGAELAMPWAHPADMRAPAAAGAQADRDNPPARAIALSHQASRHRAKVQVRGPRPASADLERVVLLQREGISHRKRGDYVAAHGKLAELYSYCKDRLGEHHQATKSSACSLADIYVLGLLPGQEPSDMKVSHSGGSGEASATAIAAAPLPPAERNAAAAKALAAPPTRLDALPVWKVKDQVVPVLAAAIENASSPEKRLGYVQALGELGPAAAPAATVLARRLEGCADAAEVVAVLRALQRMGPAAKPAMPAVSRLQNEVAKAKERGFTERQVGEIVRHTDQLNSPTARVGVRDRAGCFSLGALRQSTLQLAELASSHGVEVLVETSTAGPADPAKVLANMGPRAVYVAINTKGPDVVIRLSDQLRKDGVDPEPLRHQLLTAFRGDNFDAGLAESVKQILAVAVRDR
jgi:hypothetical protein